MPRRFRRTCPVCGRPDLKNISTHLLQVHGLSSKERKPYLKQARVSSCHPYSDLPRPSEGEQETKKLRMATTLGAEKKRNDLTKREKMTNAPVRTAASEPDQHTTETKKVELNKLCSNTVYIFLKLVYERSFTDAPHCISILS